MKFSFFLCVLFVFLFAWNEKLSAQYILMGTADYFENADCIQLTPDMPYSEGIAWYESKTDLSRSFFIEFDIYLGTKNELGADGICFVMQDDRRQYEAYGTYGEGIGYGRFNPFRETGVYIAPSIAIEFDTYQNVIQNDPPHDHIAYLENGSNRHQEYWPQDNPDFRMTDGELHNFRFSWDPESKIIEVYFDFEPVIRVKRDLINDVFAGNPFVVWGFTSSTGRKYNQQYFCLKRMARNNLPLYR
ncbi:MAG: lectin [Cyclobacteriaceae bacterium]|nr:lectin [Cyclobacteriaceae bacterium]MCH8516677.1 lectin [Cyclobacteriaceae bacterium]